MTLSIMCVTKMEPFALPFISAMRALAHDCGAEFVVGLDGGARYEQWGNQRDGERIILVDTAGYLERVHDDVLAHCRGDYVLRLDDDEKCSPAMAQWVRLGSYKAKPHWKFCRAHLWGAPDKMLRTSQLWPDEQTRLSVKALAGGRDTIHAGSPFGGGELAPVLIEHHKFLVRTLAERLDIVRRYDGIAEGAGRDFMAFNAPEIAYRGESVKLIPLNDGRTDVGHYEQQCGGCGTWVTL